MAVAPQAVSTAEGDRLLRDALTAARSGRLQEACSIGERALRLGGDVVVIHALLGMLRLDLGEAGPAIEHLEIAHSHRPTDIRIASDLAGALASEERFDRALEIASREMAFADPTLRLARIRGAVAVQNGQCAVAIEALEHVVAKEPMDWESWNNLGNALRDAKEPERSADAFERALLVNSASPQTRMNYASVLRELRRTEEAESLLRELADEFAKDPIPLRELHFLLKDARRDEEALVAINMAVARAPLDVDLLIEQGNHLAGLQRMKEAEAAYREALRIEPLSARAFAGLALVLELTNRTSDLAELAEEAEKRGVADASNFVRGYHYRRTKDYDAGLQALEHVPAELEPARQLHLRGQLLEGAGRYDEAFEAFSKMNELFRQDTSLPEERGAEYRETIRYFKKTVTQEWVDSWRELPVADDRSSPVFLVGFPRSGTTLLDTILMSHPDIEVLEEEPALRTAIDLFPSFLGLPTFTGEQVNDARDRYLETASALRSSPERTLLIDKNPLTMNLVPFVRRIFPDARFLLALRHPCDVVLSCFVANFRLNEGMSSFVRLETAAELYDLSFSYFEQVEQLMPMATHVVRYENIVEDRTSELRNLFGFLGLEWDDAVLDHQATALARGRIKTASYAQVVEPIYKRSAGRWRNYRSHLEPVLPTLAPWIEKFGYEL